MRGDHGAGPARRRSADPDQMEAVFAELAADLAPVYRRRDLRANGVLYLRGLLMPGVAGNCWSIAEAVGLDRPYRLHHLLERSCWEEDALRDVVRAFLPRHLGAAGGVLIFDETGQAKKGTKTAAVGRQYSGTMGRVENVIVAVYTTYATERGHALSDRDLYVQADWFADAADVDLGEEAELDQAFQLGAGAFDVLRQQFVVGGSADITGLQGAGDFVEDGEDTGVVRVVGREAGRRAR